MGTQESTEEKTETHLIQGNNGGPFKDLGYEEEVTLLDYWRVLYR